MRVFAAFVALSTLVGCTHASADVKPPRKACSASILIEDSSKTRVLCFGEPHTLASKVDTLAAEASEEACPRGYLVESKNFLENQHVHGTAIWVDSYEAIIVCTTQ